MVYGEVLCRQGWWTKEFETEAEADRWVFAQIINEAESVNPVTSWRVRRKPIEPLPVPLASRQPFDEVWADWPLDQPLCRVLGGQTDA